jgi:hypothetical protein
MASPGEIFACHQHLAPQRREVVIVQGFFQHLRAEQAGEDAHAAEEDGAAQVEELEHGGEDDAVVAQAVPDDFDTADFEQPVQDGDRHRPRRQAINPPAALGEKGLLHSSRKTAPIAASTGCS